LDLQLQACRRSIAAVRPPVSFSFSVLLLSCFSAALYWYHCALRSSVVSMLSISPTRLALPVLFFDSSHMFFRRTYFHVLFPILTVLLDLLFLLTSVRVVCQRD
jgi:hypothetical protein